MYLSYIHPTPFVGVVLILSVTYGLGWRQWTAEHGIPFEQVAKPSEPTRQNRIIGRLLSTAIALSFALAATACFEVTAGLTHRVFHPEIFDAALAAGLFFSGTWSLYRFALGLHHLCTKPIPNERSSVLSALFFWLLTGIGFQFAALNQVLHPFG